MGFLRGVLLGFLLGLVIGFLIGFLVGVLMGFFRTSYGFDGYLMVSCGFLFFDPS